MKYLPVAIVLLSVTGVLSVARASKPEPESFRFRCEFEKTGLGKGEENFFCRVSGKRWEGKRSRGSSEIEVDCSNGFELDDRKIAVAESNDDLFLIGKEHDALAVLSLDVEKTRDRDFDTERNNERHVDADLLIAQDEHSKRLFGRCEIEFYKPRPTPTSTPTFTPSPTPTESA